MKDLTQGNISKNLFLFAVPSLISAFFSYAMHIIDQMMLGKLVGDGALAAASCTSGYIGIMWGIVGGLAMGYGIRLSYLVGAGDDKKTRTTIRTNLVVSSAIGIAMTLLTVLLWKPIFVLLKVPADVYVEARNYFLIFSGAFLPCFLNNALGRTFLSFGNSVVGMRLDIASAIANVVLNFLFIVVLDMGTAGAAIATVIAVWGVMIAYLVLLRGEMKKLGGEDAPRRIQLREYAPIGRLAAPCLLQQLAMYLCSFFLQPYINMLGTATIAAASVGANTLSLVGTAYQQCSIGCSVFVGQCVGHKRTSLVRRGLRASAQHILILCLPLIALLFFFPRLGAFVFLSDPYGEAADVVILYLRWCAPFILAQGFSRLFHNFFRGVMRPSFNTVASTSQGVVSVILGVLLIPKMGVMGLIIAYISSWCVDLLVCVALYLSRRWKVEKYIEAERAEREALAGNAP